jgi:hypothetical protein
MTYRERQRLLDILVAIDTIRSHVARGTLDDGLVFDAVRIRLLEVGEAVNAPLEDLVRLPGRLSRARPRRPLRGHTAHPRRVAGRLNRSVPSPVASPEGSLPRPGPAVVGRAHNAPGPLETALNC